MSSHRVGRAVLPVVFAALASAASADVLLDNTRMVDTQTYDRGNANGLGRDLDGNLLDPQVADDFVTTQSGHVVTRVMFDSLKFSDAPWNKVLLYLYEDDGRGHPRETPTFEQELTSEIHCSPFQDTVFGLNGVRADLTGLDIPLLPDHKYWISVQGVLATYGDGAYIPRNSAGDAALRDGPLAEYSVYGWTDWRLGGETSYGAGNSSYFVEAIPEPVSFALLLLAAGVSRRR